MSRTDAQTPEERAQRRAKYLSGLLWHIGTFLIINTFFVILDLIGGGGINWSPWIILFWGFALAFHVLAYLVDGRQVEERMSRRYLDDERRRGSPQR